MATKRNGKHMTKDSREVIEEGLRSGKSAGKIAREIRVSGSTVTREVKANRTVKPPRRADRAALCARYRSCERVGGACEGCSALLVRCRDCRTRDCTSSCPDFELAMCPRTESWPYVCPQPCPKRRGCSFPKCSYDAADAEGAYRGRLSSSREGADISPEELRAMNGLVVPLAKRGQSLEAIWATHGGELPVSLRTAYAYQERGLLEVGDVDMPRKARLRPRRRGRKGPKGRDRVDRSGREYADFESLPLELRARVCMLDSVEGRSGEASDILTMHLLARKFQLYLLKAHADPAATVAALDGVERALGSRAAFEAAFPVMLPDRGVEFDDWAGMERSCLEPGKKRCRVFYCDAQATNQKSQAERNHEQLRRILPKRRSRFDRLAAEDVALACSHVNSYPLATLGGKCALDALGGLIGPEALARLGVRRVPADEVVLRPSLLPHAVDR